MSILVVLRGNVLLDSVQPRVLGPLSYAALAGGSCGLSCQKGDCVFYWFPSGTLLGAIQNGLAHRPQRTQDDSLQANIHDLATMPRRPLKERQGVEVSRHVGPLNLERAIVERWRDGLEVTDTDRLLSGSGLVLAGDVLFEIAGERPARLSPGSYFELPKFDASFRARCASEECLLLSSCDSTACSVEDQAKEAW